MTRDSSSGPAQPHLVPGYRLDRYELLCPIAEGGMASVWVARLRAKHGFEKLVAVKTILPKHAEDPRFQEMFLDEARIASKIDHVNVAHVLDLGDDHGVLYLVMEWVEGDSLSKLERALRAAGDAIPLTIALRIVADVCAGLHVAHELRGADGALLGVVHRDVSPQNILVGSSGNVKVIDFGIAKARDRLSGETSTGSLKGKIQFMSPEQAIGQAIDRRADVWSTGSVLYQLLAGVPPYEGTNQYATLHKIASGDRPMPLPPGTPPGVIAIVDKALAFDPANRFATMADMRSAIEAAIDELSGSVTSKDVADFASRYLSARAEQRRKSIELAMRAAAERDRVTKLLVAPDSDPQLAEGVLERSRMPTVPDVVTELDRAEGSYRSLGAASMPTLPPLHVPLWRRGGVIAGAALAGALMVFAVGRATGTKAVSSSATSPPPAVSRPFPAAPQAPIDTIASAPPPTPSASAAQPAHALASATRARPGAHAAPPQHPNAAGSASTSTQRLPIDDGF